VHDCIQNTVYLYSSLADCGLQESLQDGLQGGWRDGLRLASPGIRSMSTVIFHYTLYKKRATEVGMVSQTVTVKGQVTLKRDLLQHLGIKPGERIDFEKLPGGELRIRAARPAGTIDGFLHAL